jgi:hypothetical protein
MEHLFTTAHIVNVLRNTLRRLEEGGAFTREDPALIHLKRRLILAIAELEVQKTRPAVSGREKPASRRTRPTLVLRLREPEQADPAPELEMCFREK